MRILHITSHLNVGGIARYIVSLSRSLIARGHDVVIASAGGYLEDRTGVLGLAQWRVPLNTSQEFSPKVFRSIRQITECLKQEPVDIIHAHTRVGQVVADQISHRLKIPYVTTWHGIYKPRLGRKAYPCVGEVCIAISEVVQKHLRDDFQIPQERIRVVCNGVNTANYAILPEASVIQTYRKRWQISDGQPVIGGIGRLAAGEVKGFDLLLAAACLLSKTIPGLQVLMVGDGPRRPFLEDVAERLDILSQVRFVGAADDIRIPLALMDVFVFPSRWPEAFGLTLIEAMAAGKPVVATRMGAVPEIMRDGIDGLLVDPEDIGALAENVARFLNDRTLAEKLSRQAQRRVQDQFDIEQTALNVEKVYQEVIGQH